MCAQCMASAAAAVTGVTGVRAWLGTRRWSWLTPRVLRRVTVAMVAVGLVAVGVGVG